MFVVLLLRGLVRVYVCAILWLWRVRNATCVHFVFVDVVRFMRNVVLTLLVCAITSVISWIELCVAVNGTGRLFDSDIVTVEKQS